MHPQRDVVTPHRSSGRAVARLVVALVVGVVLVVEAVLLVQRRADRGEVAPRLRPVGEHALRAAPPEVRAAGLLAAWDRRRADAWAAGDQAALLGLYTGGSAAGRRDRVMLAAWLARGLRVVGLRTQVVRLRVLAHRPGRWELEVVDRVVGGTAVIGGPGVPAARVELPRDAPSTRRVVLVAGPSGGWRVASVVGRAGRVGQAERRVSAVPPPAPP